MMLDAPMSRRGFVGGVAAMGALAASGAVGVPAAHATEGSMVAENAPGAGLPWSGSGSQRGDWTSTPEDIERLGGCTMPLEELNYRRELYVSSKGEYTCADGTVVPAVYNKMRALIHTYGVGAGNTVLDSSFTNLVKNVTEEQAQAYLDMPRGVDFTPIDLQAKGGRTLDECRKLCDALADAGYLVRSTRNTGMTYHQAAWGEGIGGYILNDESMAEPSTYEWPLLGEGLEAEYAKSGSPIFYTIPCDRSVVSDGAPLTYDDVEDIIRSHEHIAVTPCSCRYTLLSDSGEDHPSYEDFLDGSLSEYRMPDSGQRVETCLMLGDEAEYYVSLGTARYVSQEEALEIIHKSRDEGLILNNTFGKNSDVICQCHRDAGCSIIGTWLAMGGLDDITGSEPFRYVSNYTLEVDLDSCLRCGACSERCPMQAITMDGEHGGQDGYPSVSNLCFRCGQCAYTCPVEARKLVKKAKEDIPEMPQAMLDDYNLKAAYRFEHGMVI